MRHHRTLHRKKIGGAYISTGTGVLPKPKVVRTPRAKPVKRDRTGIPPSGTPEYFRYVRYGVTEADYDRMMEEQGKTCPICLTAFTEVKKVCVDHCHDSNKVRGLLCDRCNRALGAFEDDAAMLERALIYLKR